MLPGPPWQLQGCKKKCGGARKTLHPTLTSIYKIASRESQVLQKTSNLEKILEKKQRIEVTYAVLLHGLSIRTGPVGSVELLHVDHVAVQHGLEVVRLLPHEHLALASLADHHLVHRADAHVAGHQLLGNLLLAAADLFLLLLQLDRLFAESLLTFMFLGSKYDSDWVEKYCHIFYPPAPTAPLAASTVVLVFPATPSLTAPD